MTKKMLRLSDKGKAMIKKGAIGVGVPILALSGYGLIKVFRPPPPTPPFVREIPGPAPSAPAHETEIDAAVRLHLADDLMKQAETGPLLLCRAVRYCDAQKLYESVRDTLETMESCSVNCDAMKIRVKSRQAYIEARYSPIANSVGCVVGQEFCACVALAAGSNCR